MESPDIQDLKIPVDEHRRVSGLLQGRSRARACLVLAHGAGAGMEHPFLAELAGGLARRRIASLRFQFPYMENRIRRPDPPVIAHAAVRAAVAQAASLCPGLPIFAGGKSFGGRMTSQAQAESPLAGVRGLVFLGFPLHPAGKPSTDRARHLMAVAVPMLFLQGTGDALADLPLLESVLRELGSRARLELFGEADHSFHAPRRLGLTDTQIRDKIVDAITAWMDTILKVH